MKSTTSSIASLLLVFLFSSVSLKAQEITGVVTDAGSGKPIPGAAVQLPKVGRGVATDEQGRFSLENVDRKQLLLQVTSLGYQSKTLRLKSVGEGEAISVELQPSTEDIDEVVVLGGLFRTKGETPYQTVRVGTKQIHLGGEINLMQSISEEPGVDFISLGPAIAKPVVRGLSFSRVMTVYNGLRLENQQWGADHGLWASSTGIAGVEVIKGPASIIYGSGALGGVVQLLEEPVLPRGEQKGNFRSEFHSVSLGTHNEIGLRGTSEDGVFYSFRGSRDSHADYRAGSGQVIGNSRFNNRVFKADVGLQRSFGNIKLSFHEIHQNLGIIGENEMEESLATTRGDRDMILPFQRVNDRFVSLQSSFYTGASSSLQANLNFHRHHRREIEEAFDQVDLGLLLQTVNYDVKYQFTPLSGMEITTGVQGFFQDNSNLTGAGDILVPNSDLWDAGIYTLASYNIGSWSFLGGARVDRREVHATSPVSAFSFPGEGDHSSAQSTFQGWTASAGFSRKLGSKFRLKVNGAKGFRAPDLAELYSNGPHPGTQRFEMGDPDFGREENFELDISLEGEGEKLRWQLGSFYNFIEDYIFFSATGEERNGLNLWRFQQNDAAIYGGEVSLRWQPYSNWQVRHNTSYQIAQDVIAEIPLPLIPPLKGHSRLSYRWKAQELSLSHRYAAAQNRAAPGEEPTPGYQLFDLSAVHYFDWGFSEGSIALSLHNVFNEVYFNHMALTREFGVFNPGRNFRVKVNFNF